MHELTVRICRHEAYAGYCSNNGDPIEYLQKGHICSLHYGCIIYWVSTIVYYWASTGWDGVFFILVLLYFGILHSQTVIFYGYSDINIWYSIFWYLGRNAYSDVQNL